MEDQRSLLPKTAKQEREIPPQWSWVEPSVWSDKMLAALEMGVKGGKWFSLIDKVYAMANLASAWKHVASNRGSAGIDNDYSPTPIQHPALQKTCAGKISTNLRTVAKGSVSTQWNQTCLDR